MPWNFGDSSDEEERTDRFKSERSVSKTVSSSNKVLPSLGSLDRRVSPKNKVRDRRTSDSDKKKRSRSRSSHRKLDGRDRRHGSGDRLRNSSMDRGRNESRDRVRRDSREKSRNKSHDPLRIESFDSWRDDHDRDRFHLKHVSHSQCAKVRSSHDRHRSRDTSPKHSHDMKSSDRKRPSPIQKHLSPEIKKSNSESKKSKHRSSSRSPTIHSSKRGDNGTVNRNLENHKDRRETKFVALDNTDKVVSVDKVVKVKKCKRKAKLQEKESLENRDSSEESKKHAKVEKTNSFIKSSRESPIKSKPSLEKNSAPTKDSKKEVIKMSPIGKTTKKESPEKIKTVPSPDVLEDNQTDDATAFLCKDNTETGDMKEERVYGPSLPERPAVDESQSYGPALPPSMAPRSEVSSDQSPPPSNPSPREGSPESDDCTYGPALPGAEPDITQIALQHRARILKMHQNQENNSGKERLEREEWMTQLPERGQALGLGLAARGFRTRDSDAQRDDSWTDTPEEKARKKRLAQAGVVVPSKKKVKEEDVVAKQRDEAMEKIAKKHQKDKSKSLLEMHQDKLKKQKKDKDEKPERRPFSRETDLNVNQLSDAQKKSIYKKAAALDSRFSSGHAKYL